MLIATVVLSIVVSALAQEKPKRKPVKLAATTQAMMRMSKMWSNLKKLGLTDEQDAKLAGIRDETAPKMKEVMDKIKAILTEEQAQTATDAAKEAKEAGKTGRDFFAAVQASIELSDEQQEKMDKIAPEVRAVQRQMMKSLMGILTPEQQEKMKKLRSAGKKKGKKAE